MEIKRTANAGVLLRLDGKQILLDGVCNEIKPYLATPAQIRMELLRQLPDAVAFTHFHEDHCDPAFVSEYLQKTAGPILGPADIPFSTANTVTVGDLRITQISTNHLGVSAALGHHSFVIEGTRCVWFMGDASPLQWRKLSHLPRPDVLIAPYAYAIGNGWQIACQLEAEAVVLLHLPEKNNDPYDLWKAVAQTTGQGNGPKLYIPGMGETVRIFET